MYLLRSSNKNVGNIITNLYQKSGNGITMVTELHRFLPISDLHFQFPEGVELNYRYVIIFV